MKENRKQMVKQMLYCLFTENERGGFNEFAQFCEERLRDLIDSMTDKQITWLIEEIENTSCQGLNRRNYKKYLEC